MRALRWHGAKDIRLENVAEPSAGPGKVKIRVCWCGLCGSDLHEYESGPLMIPRKPHPLTGKMPPITLGHEFSGVVTEVGPGVTRVRVADRVAVRPTMPCYECLYCRKAKYIQCVKLGTIGAAADGAFADFVVVPEDTVHPIPDGMSDELGALAEPLACTVHAVKRAGLSPGDSVAVIGAGPIGLLCLQVAAACGAGAVYALETVPVRKEMAARLGATAVIDPSQGDAGKEIAALTGGLRADVVFECAGPAPAMLLALKVCGKGGKIVEVGQMAQDCSFPFGTLWMHEKTIITSQGYVDEFPVAISYLASGRVNGEAMITARIKLDEVIDQGFLELLGERRYKHCKILVQP